MTQNEALLAEFEHFVDYYSRFYAYHGTTEAEDFAQAARLMLLTKADLIPPSAKRHSYACSLIKNTIIEETRKRTMRNKYHIYFDALVEEAEGPNDCATADTFMLVEQILSGMPHHYQEAVMACATHGDIKTASESLGWTEPRYKSALYRARELAGRIAG